MAWQHIVHLMASSWAIYMWNILLSCLQLEATQLLFNGFFSKWQARKVQWNYFVNYCSLTTVPTDLAEFEYICADASSTWQHHVYCVEWWDGGIQNGFTGKEHRGQEMRWSLQGWAERRGNWWGFCSIPTVTLDHPPWNQELPWRGKATPVSLTFCQGRLQEAPPQNKSWRGPRKEGHWFAGRRKWRRRPQWALVVSCSWDYEMVPKSASGIWTQCAVMYILY